jgi:hypothetical protein
MLKPRSRVVKLADVLRWRSLSDGVAWVLTRDEEFTDSFSREPKKCFVGDLFVHPDSGGVLELYYDNEEATWRHLRREIAAGKIKTTPPAWRPSADDGWQENSSIQIDFKCRAQSAERCREDLARLTHPRVSGGLRG